MDAASGTGITLDGVILALFLLCLTGIATMVTVYGSNIRKDIGKLFDKLEQHAQDDIERDSLIHRRVGNIAQRVTNIDHRTEET